MIPSWSLWFSFNAVSWSISTEAFFYASFPLLSRWIAVRPTMKLVTCGMVLVGIAIGWNLVRGSPTLDDGPTRFFFYIAPSFAFSNSASGLGSRSS